MWPPRSSRGERAWRVRTGPQAATTGKGTLITMRQALPGSGKEAALMFLQNWNCDSLHLTCFWLRWNLDSFIIITIVWNISCWQLGVILPSGTNGRRGWNVPSTNVLKLHCPTESSLATRGHQSLEECPDQLEMCCKGTTKAEQCPPEHPGTFPWTQPLWPSRPPSTAVRLVCLTFGGSIFSSLLPETIYTKEYLLTIQGLFGRDACKCADVTL